MKHGHPGGMQGTTSFHGMQELMHYHLGGPSPTLTSFAYGNTPWEHAHEVRDGIVFDADTPTWGEGLRMMIEEAKET